MPLTARLILEHFTQQTESLFSPNVDRSVFQMLTAWAEQAEKLRNGGITKEQYDQWRYTFPEQDTTQRWAKVPSQQLSDFLVDALKIKDR